MEWKESDGTFARRFVLEDGTPVIAVLKDAGEEKHLTFYTDVNDFESIELESEKLGGLPDLIDTLRPEDIIEICCRMGRSAKAS